LTTIPDSPAKSMRADFVSPLVKTPEKNHQYFLKLKAENNFIFAELKHRNPD
jgi:hypothetical protein